MELDIGTLAKALVMFAAILTPMAVSNSFKAAFEAIGRNPSLENSLFSKAIIAAAMIEVTLIFAFLAFFVI